MTVKINLKSRPYYFGSKILDGKNYRLKIMWNTLTAKWYLDLTGLNNSIAIFGIALSPGVDLLKPYGYEQLGSLFVYDNQNAGDDPNYDDIGKRFTLEYLPK